MSLLDSLKKQLPSKKIETVEFYKINDILYVDNNGIATLFDVNIRTVNNWKKLGLSPTELAGGKSQIYPFFELLNWHRENVKTANASIGKGSKPIRYQITKIETKEEEDVNNIDEAEARRRKIILEVQQKKLDLSVAKKEFISASELGTKQAEIIMMFLGNLRAFLQQWPFQFEGKSSKEIRELMDESVHKMVSSMQADINRHIGEEIDVSYYDVLQSIIESGKTPEEVIKIVSKA